jgi:hypothetical protein
MYRLDTLQKEYRGIPITESDNKYEIDFEL